MAVVFKIYAKEQEMDRYSFQTLGLFVSLLAVSLTACVPVEPPNLQVQSPASASPVTLAVAQQASTSKAGSSEQDGAESTALEKADKPKELAVATFGGGCFWCVEGVFENMKGVKDVVSGYSGGHVVNPTYKQVCYEDTGHAEVCQIHYDPAEVSFVDLMEVFFKTHDPTTLNRQGNDRGPQYRSCIFYHDGEQKALAEKYKKKLDESGAFRSPIVTQIAALDKFYKAEEYHQDYFRKNPGDGYCAAVVRPKVEKFKKVFADKIQEP